MWFVGFSGDYTCGVWGGFDDNTAQTEGNYVKYLWKSVMEATSDHYNSRGKLADTGNLTSAEICTKCGGLAVHGLCNDTMQGDMTVTEWFVPGTEPTESCDCHVRLSVCEESGKIAGKWCPIGARETGIYLTHGTAGTEDAEYSAEDFLGTACDTHTHVQDIFSDFFGKDGEKDESGNTHDNHNNHDNRPSDGWSWGSGDSWDWESIYNQGRDYIDEWGSDIAESWDGWSFW